MYIRLSVALSNIFMMTLSLFYHLFKQKLHLVYLKPVFKPLYVHWTCGY